MKSKFASMKSTAYFQIYDDLLSKYRGKRVTFVEIGVQNGGSLFMWREFLGPDARIIGIDLNPEVKRWEADGFEIHIGNQADPAFWQEFFRVVGDVDVVLDDGGHTNEQQLVTTLACIPHIRDGGKLIVEDTHASYFRSFQNPAKYSFINFCKGVVDCINSRFAGVRVANDGLKHSVYSIGFYDSVVCFNIDRGKCFASKMTSNGKEVVIDKDLRHAATLSSLKQAKGSLGSRLQYLKRVPGLWSAQRIAFDALVRAQSRLRTRRLKRYFPKLLRPTR